MSASRSRSLKWCLAIVLFLAAFAGARFVFGSPKFDPDRVAESETRMWQAYYTGDRTQLGLELISLLRYQYSISLLEARDIAERLANAALKFHAAKGNYETVVLPELTDAYRRIKQASSGTFDPDAVARAELAWWVARRMPGQNSAEQVGEKIAKLYALLYGVDRPSFHTAGRLRAEAAKLRDSGRESTDWKEVQRLLIESYREVQKGM